MTESARPKPRSVEIRWREKLIRDLKRGGALVLAVLPRELSPGLINRYLEVRPARCCEPFAADLGGVKAVHARSHSRKFAVVWPPQSMPRSAAQIMITEPVAPLDRVRGVANLELDPDRKGALGQFMTPSNIAAFMAGLFTRRDAPSIRLLDAGAGVGSLTAAFLDACLGRLTPPATVACTAYEIDPLMRRFLAQTLSDYQDKLRAKGIVSTVRVVDQDFIAEGTEHALLRLGPRFSHAILNPPYRKIGVDSAARKLLRDIGVETVNLYTGFLAVAITLMDPGGELVAIVPRSFCNGTYYRPFRAWMREHAALSHIHLFERRDRAFKDDGVLQENIIVKWVRDAPQGPVEVSWCADASFSDLQRQTHRFADITRPGDPEGFIHIPLQPVVGSTMRHLDGASLADLGITVSTGPVVDFRLKEHLRQAPGHDTAPLLYPQHFVTGALRYPGTGKKPSAIVVNDDTRRWLLPNSWYVITKRFTSKEERKRVAAHVIDPAVLPGKWLGLENHVNVFHRGKNGLDPDLARGLALFLNSTHVDEVFRAFSGHTQVNATDLRNIRYPTRETLLRFGRWARARSELSQEEIDAQVEEQCI